MELKQIMKLLEEKIKQGEQGKLSVNDLSVMRDAIDTLYREVLISAKELIEDENDEETREFIWELRQYYEALNALIDVIFILEKRNEEVRE